ncbi:hypothetical protein BDZ91DRAFT_419440 [Kalaharituber pfeilii]|nr:hypothetical protein BDZ91DRAFT_419440 [Kalaharituber pfeilii]
MVSNLSQFSSTPWSNGEAVTVNTRALIDKVLARYSAEHTVFRELFQNASDADAKNIVLRWESGEEFLGDGETRGFLAPQEQLGEEERKDTKVDNVAESARDFANPPQPPPPYFQQPKRLLTATSSKSSHKESKRKKSSFLRLLKNTLSSGNLGSSNASSASVSQEDSPTPRFSTTGPTVHTTNTPDLSAYAQGSEALRDILFESPPEKGREPTRKLYRRLIVQNDGKPFGEADWARLRRIAEGNPDESKIGAFGVGFYSVFSECDEPTVYSGGKAMAFYWDGDRDNGGGNQLMTRTADAGDAADDGWTVFSLPYRQLMPLPGLPELLRFLATSLIFVKLETITVYVDGLKLFTVGKRTVNAPMHLFKHKAAPAPGKKKANPASDASNKSDGTGIRMDIAEVEVSHVELRAEYLDGIFGQQAGEGGPQIESVALEIATADIRTDVDGAVAVELKRATLKPPPKETRLSIVSSITVKMPNLTVPTDNESHVFAHILPSTKPRNELPPSAISAAGRVFIGFQTHQTTGFQCHLSTHSVIPTVERENIDFNARHVKDWNLEMLRMAGILARCMYNMDMEKLVQLSRTSIPWAIEAIVKRVMQKYAFRETTPSTQVGEAIKKAFFEYEGVIPAISVPLSSPRSKFMVLSSEGIVPVRTVSIATSPAMENGKGFLSNASSDCDWLLENFIQTKPLMPKSLVDASPIFIKNLIDNNMLPPVLVTDVIADLKGRDLDFDQAKSLLMWLFQRSECAIETQKLTRTDIAQVLANANVFVNSEQGKINLSSISSYIPTSSPIAKMGDIPLPNFCIPQELLKPEIQERGKALETVFGWTQLDLVEWLSEIVRRHHNLSSDKDFAAKVLRILNAEWSSLSSNKKHSIKSMLDIRQCIPTRNHGVCLPSSVHFSGVNWAGSLAMLADELEENAPDGVSEAFLQYLGVRKTVELRTVLEKLMRHATNTENGNMAAPACNQAELVDYLLTLQEIIPKGDMATIRNIAFCSAEGSKKLYKPHELYRPDDELRRLGLPIMMWPKSWDETPFAAKTILEDLGLKQIPDLVTVAKIAASPGYDDATTALRDIALKYMLSKWGENSYGSSFSAAQFKNIKFLPVEDPWNTPTAVSPAIKRRLVAIDECYSSPKAAMMGFSVLRQDLKDHAGKFGLLEHPPLQSLIDALTTRPPVDEEQARHMFGYMAYFNNSLTSSQIDHLQMRQIVPVRVKPTLITRDIESEHEGYEINAKLDPQQWYNKISAPETETAVDEKLPTTTYEHRRPTEVYLMTAGLGTTKRLHALFEFVDFGFMASQFLVKVGARPAPNDLDIANLLVARPRYFLEVMGSSEYRYRLRQLAMSQDIWMPAESELGRRMKTSKFLIGERVVKMDVDVHQQERTDHDYYGDEPTERRKGDLVTAPQVLVVDDYNSYKQFKQHVRVCPFEDVLETMCTALGSQPLSKCIETSYQVGSVVNNPKAVETLHKTILERTPLFFHESPEVTVRTDPKKWLKEMKVNIVSNITLEQKIKGAYTLDGMTASHRYNTTAAVPEPPEHEQPSNVQNADGNTVVVSAEWTTYDLARAILGRLCKVPKPGSVYLFEGLLREDLRELEARGINVRRIIRGREEEAKLAAIQHSATPINQAYKVGNGTTRAMGTTRVNGHAGGSTENARLRVANAAAAVSAVKPFVGATVMSKATSTPALEPATYCDHIPGHELTYHDKVANEMRVYLPSTNKDRNSLYVRYEADFEQFSTLLESLAGVLKVPLTCMHLCHEATGDTIAFNMGGSLFFNLHYWHLNEHNQTNDQARADALTYWFMVFCHELAHNLVGPHNATHSYHTETIAARNIPNLARLLPGVSLSNRKVTPLKLSEQHGKLRVGLFTGDRRRNGMILG